MSASLPAHPKILQLGKVHDLLDGTIIVEEKIDGSQFAFGRAADDGRLVFRSKGRELFPENVDKLFANTVAAVQAREDDIMRRMLPGEFLYGEALHAPKHNTLAYERVPQGHLVLFGGSDATGAWMHRGELEELAGELRFDVTPVLSHLTDIDPVDTTAIVEHLRGLVDGPSFLGGKREGIVIKNYGKQIHYNGIMSPIFCKLVSDGFKEKHNENWKPGRDLLADLLNGYRSEARWQKAVQYLRERKLAQHYRDEVRRIAVRGLPEWYKQSLVSEPVEVPA